jgi:hypothetical protein
VILLLEQKKLSIPSLDEWTYAAHLSAKMDFQIGKGLELSRDDSNFVWRGRNIAGEAFLWPIASAEVDGTKANVNVRPLRRLDLA